MSYLERNSADNSSRRWSLKLAALYGMAFMVGLHALLKPQDYVSEYHLYSGLHYAARCLGHLIVGPMLFVPAAFVRNLIFARA
jgi:hypothetical protein